MGAITAVLVALSAPPTLPQVAPAQPIAWAYVPHLGPALRRLAPTPSQSLLGLFLPRASQAPWARVEQGEFLAAMYRGADARPDLGAWLDAGDGTTSCSGMLARAMRSAELLRGSKNVHLTGAGAGRCSWSNQARLASVLDEPLASSLAGSNGFLRLGGTAAEADVYAQIDVQRLYGMLARRSNGARIAGIVSRLGLAGVGDIDVTARIEDARALVLHAVATLPAPWVDLPGALGPPIAPMRPAALPTAATAMARFSVHPARLWYTLEKLFAYASTIEYTLARAQLDAVERQLGKSWTEDALGDAPRSWTLYRVPTLRGGVAELLIAEVDDAAAAQVLVESIAGLLPQISANLRVESTQVRGARLVSIEVGRGRGIHLGFAKDHILVGRNRQAVARHLGKQGRVRPLVGIERPSVGHGFVEAGAFAVNLPETADLPRSVWKLTAEAERLHLEFRNGR